MSGPISPSRVPNAPISRRRTRRTWDGVLDSDLAIEESQAIDSLTGILSCKGDELTPPLDVEIPGQGRPGNGCGDLVKARCNDCGSVFEIEQSCGLRVCPRCYKKWARREALAARDVAMARIFRYPGDHIVHAVVSIPGGPEDVFNLRTRAIAIAKDHGVLGFSVVGHHVREDENGDWIVDGNVHYHILGVVTQEDGFKTVPDLVEEDFLHDDLFHGGGPRIYPRGRVKGTYNYVFKVIKQNRGRSWWVPPRPEVLYKKYYYMLEHASIQHRRHALTWAGTWWDRDDIDANQVGGPGEEGAITCPECGSDDITIEVVGVDERTLERYMERRPEPFDYLGSAFLKLHQAGGGRCHVEPYFKKKGDQPPGGE